MRVLLAMSGGVDSCVAAHLLTQAGHTVTGITLVFHPDVTVDRCGLKVCCDRQDLLDARSVCRALGIPHVELDLSDVFNRRVIMPFIDDYRLGDTPNPCGRCNRFLKIGGLVERLESVDCEALATGHYCRMVDGVLHRGRDRVKDQSYFLSMVRPEHLSRMIFPLGDLTKDTVRQLAADLKLPVAAKQESQELCFTGGRSPSVYVGEAIGNRPGFIKHVNGRILGRHEGVFGFTIGQRRGLGVSWHEPLYVVALDARTGTVTVGERSHLERRTVTVHSFNRLSQPGDGMTAAIRYNQEPMPIAAWQELGNGRIAFTFSQPVTAVATGQLLVAYLEDRVVGGGIIEGAS